MIDKIRKVNMKMCVFVCVRVCMCARTRLCVFFILKSILYFSEKKEEEENTFISANVLDCSKIFE